MVGRQIARAVGVDRLDPGDESAHTIVIDNPPRVDGMAIQRGDDAETIAETCGEVTRCAQDADDRNSHCAARHFHAGVEGIALHNGVEARALGLDRLLDKAGVSKA